MGVNELFGRYLFFSFCYYKMNVTLIPDETYDKMCVTLLENWDNITHKYKPLILKEDFEAGTGFAIQYPKNLENYFTREFMRIRSDNTQSKKWVNGL